MTETVYQIRIEAPDELAAQRATQSLADNMREVPGVIRVERRKEDESTMDIGTAITIAQTALSSAATLALAKGVADWLTRSRRTRLVIIKDPKAHSIKVEVENINPAVAMRITEMINSE